MIRKWILSIMAVTALQVVALDVANTAGALHDNVSDTNVGTLRVTGTMNAADFYFIADHLSSLTDLDLGDVTVLACNLPEMRYMESRFAANELPVGALGGMALTRVTLPAGLKTVGKGALAGCDRLTGITLPASLEVIDDYAFAGCSALTSVTLPAGVTTVGRGAFMRCSALTSLTVEPSSRLATVGDCAMMDCPALRTLNLGAALQSVGERALAGTGLQEIDLTACRNLQTVGPWAMVQTPVQQAKLPNGLTELGDGAFLYDTTLTGVELGNKLAAVNDYALAGTGLTGDLTLPAVKSVGDYALYNTSSITTVKLPATLTWLGDSAMAGMTGMTTLVSNATTVPELGSGVWAGVNQPAVALTVPSTAKGSYQAADQWQDFMFKNAGLRGDVNNDGEVNIADVNALIEIILGGQADADTMQRADVNGDGEVNIADVNALIDLIMNGGNASSLKISKKTKRHGKK